MAAAIYSLCALTALTCAMLLMRAWKQVGASILLWSSLCFAGLTVSNVLLVLDRIVYPTTMDLSTARLATALAGLLLLLIGLVMEGPDR